MTDQNAVEAFLYDTFGYSRIDDFVRGEKDEDVPLWKYLEGTILGTFGTKSSSIDDFSGLPRWINNYKIAPHIYPMSELDEQIEEKPNLDYINYHVAVAPRGSEEKKLYLKPKIRGLGRTHFLSNTTAFVGYRVNEIRGMLREIQQNQFPNSTFNSPKVLGNYLVSMFEKDFFLFSYGSNGRFGSKLIIASFKLSEDVVDRLNGIGMRYNYLMENITQASWTPISDESEEVA